MHFEGGTRLCGKERWLCACDNNFTSALQLWLIRDGHEVKGHTEARLGFVRMHHKDSDAKWIKVSWSDVTKKGNIWPQYQAVHLTKNERRSSPSTTHHTFSKAQSWQHPVVECFSEAAPGALLRVAGIMNGAKYCTNPQENLLPSARNEDGQDVYGNYLKHTAKLTPHCWKRKKWMFLWGPVKARPK